MATGLTLVTGAGGFIGGHLVKGFTGPGARVRAVEQKAIDQWGQRHGDAENLQLDLRELGNCQKSCQGVNQVYNLAAGMGGMGFIESHKAECMLSVLINTHMLIAAREAGGSRYFYASSACVYAA